MRARREIKTNVCSLEWKEVQAWDSVGQPAVEMDKGSGKAERPKGTQVFVPLAMAVASATEA